ncbi:MAG: glycosyltransferase, partial [Prosthecobacter sp.]|nr:glycosyltransferase [Prosthecobacter sp.]
MNSTFVTAFLGNRDSYQVPYALAEADMLCQFITGTYCTSRTAKVLRVLPNKFRGKILQRHSPGIPEEKVNSRPELDMLLRLSAIFGDKSLRSWNWANRAVSLAARNAARKMKSDLLLYEPYAWESFTADYDHAPRKVLFHFHLHPVFEREVISQDMQKFPPAIKAGWQRTDAWPEWDDRVVDVWKHADLVICASSFTRESLLKQGLPPDQCRVVPYGITVSEGTLSSQISPAYSVLCVGSGIQRKGMHHLLDAWKQANLPQGSTLTLVCRYLDPCLEAELARMPAG